MTQIAVLIIALGSSAADAKERPNVLFIAIDDLRNDLGCLNVAHAKTPSLDRFAAQSRLFSRHYVQVPTCGASRCALLRGRYPSKPVHVNNNAIRNTHSEWAGRSMPGWFRRHGYRTLSLGKVTHYPGGMTGDQWAKEPEELPGVWDRCWIPDAPWKTAEAMMHGYAGGVARRRGESPAIEAFDGPDDSHPDAWVARDAVAQLRELAETDEPWFFAVGFFKPHLPFAAPKRWFDIHDADQIPAPVNPKRPQNPAGWSRSGELRNNYSHDGMDPETDPEYAAQLRRAYAASTSYADAQVGRVLETVDELGLADDTIVVIWSDHGFLLGEHAVWAKHCLYELALLSPLMIRAPVMNRPGESSDAIVETVDIFPTLIELCGLEDIPELDGRSLVRQLDEPAAPSVKPAKGYWRSGSKTVRTPQWRLLYYPEAKEETNRFELYDLLADPHACEDLAAQKPQIVAKLRSLLD